jgi:hypothetical protein
MARPPRPQEYEGVVEFFKWFVLIVTLGPMLLCAGCLGTALVTALLERPDRPPPPRTARADPATGRE